jgi:multidrug/hemolysin transport system ATP-binding protein
MEEAAKADYVAVIDNGRITAKGTPSDLRTKYSTDTLRLIPKDSEKLKKFLKDQNIKFVLSGGAFVILISSTLDALPLVKITGHIMREDAN